MLLICRAEDGEAFQVNATLWDIERTGSLELFLHQETGVDQDAILAYLSDGRRLRNENLRELSGAQDQSIFVFNKYYLDFDLDEVLRELWVEVPLQPDVEDAISDTPPIRPSQLAVTYVRTAHTHKEHVYHTLTSLHYQHEALRIASSSLDLNVLSIADAFDAFATNARRELEKQATLLANLDTDLDVIGRVGIHLEFMSATVRKAVETGREKPRTLGDYVSIVKMKQVAETCMKTHNDLRMRFELAQASMSRLSQGSNDVREVVNNIQLLDEAEACNQRSQDVFAKINEVAVNAEGLSATSDDLLQELRNLDLSLRQEVEFITNTKNTFTQQCMVALRRISALNNDLVQMPSALTSLQTDFRAKSSFSHIQRLHNMLYAYGATVIEIVRRKEFARFFYQRAQTILEVMAKLSASERKRRQVYRGDVHGQLPFDARGLDDAVPSIDFSPTGGVDSAYSLERVDIDALLLVLDQIERSRDPTLAVHPVHETRVALDKLINKMDSLESGFDRIAERSLLSASRLSSSRRRSFDVDETAFHQLADQLETVQQLKIEQEELFQKDRDSMEAEIGRLKAELVESSAAASRERERADNLERDLHLARAQNDSEMAARRTIEGRYAELSSDVESQRGALHRALTDATQQTRIAESCRQELAQVRSEYDAVKDLETVYSKKVEDILVDQATTLRNLEEARSRGEDLESQIQVARAESEEVNRALKEASREKDRLLRMQASEHERRLRDHVAEADGDRAVLEHQLSELRATIEDLDRQLKDARAATDIADSDAVGLREELQRVEHELREARHTERVLREDLNVGRSSQSLFEQKLDRSARLIAELLEVAIRFRNSHVKALVAVQAMTAHPTSAAKHPTSPTSAPDMALSTSLHSRAAAAMVGTAEEPTPIDPTDPLSALEMLREFDHDIFAEAIAKAGSTIRKWQKQCKEYRERAKGKISFRNFAKGDLALFLPTRNSVSKPWAAFNVSFPHYFLQATGHLAEQLKTREWIVARITSLTERVADHRDPASNPYGLGDGVKYYMLEVEDWTQPSASAKRKVTAPRKASVEQDSVSTSPPAVTLPPGPPQGEVEESMGATRSPTSHLFPVRTRANSSPIAGPSSLSRLLAQANAVESTPLETIPPSRSRTPSPTTSPPPPPSPRRSSGSPARVHGPSVSSPLRPGSRSSRVSTSSRFSGGRIPVPFSSSVSPGNAKAAPTTALMIDQPLSASPSSGEVQQSGSSSSQATPSPEGSASGGMTNVLLGRRRTTSYQAPRISPLAAMSETRGPAAASAGSALASLASSWGVSFGRKRKSDLSLATTTAGDESQTIDNTANTGNSGTDELGPSASDLLKQF